MSISTKKCYNVVWSQYRFLNYVPNFDKDDARILIENLEECDRELKPTREWLTKQYKEKLENRERDLPLKLEEALFREHAMQEIGTFIKYKHRLEVWYNLNHWAVNGTITLTAGFAIAYYIVGFQMKSKKVRLGMASAITLISAYFCLPKK